MGTCWRLGSRPGSSALRLYAPLCLHCALHVLLEWAAFEERVRRAAMSAMSDAIGVLLAGGQGERLWPLTRDRAKPAVPFGALYRIIDITLSNCINSDLRRVFVLTQYKALSLNRHIRAGWSPLAGLG